MRKEMITLLACAGLLLALGLYSCAALDPSPQPPQYYSPLQDAEYVSRAASIIVRYGPELTQQNVSQLRFTVRGSESGSHLGHTVLADDHKTVIFRPANAFMPGEQVSVDVSGLRLDSQNSFEPLSYNFTVAVSQKSGSPVSATPNPPDSVPTSAFPNFLTVPQDIPHFAASKASTDAQEGYIFVAPFYWTKSTIGSYLLILDGQGQLVYYQSVADQLAAFDFKVQPNGLLSYWSQKDSTFYLLDSQYRVVDSYRAGNGYFADLHDFQILPDGNALLMAYDAQTVDMSKVVQGGKQDATVTGLVIQEIDPSKNVIFEWRSWDYFSFSDSTASLTDQEIDLVHGNALALANDGNLLLSSRNLCEITKINLQTGEVMWRLGGKAGQFQFVDGDPFAFQHDVRQLANGDITVFDNHGTTDNPAASHGIEYNVDAANETATQVWEFTHSPPVFGTYMGNVERLSDGNTFISWGAPWTGAGYAWASMTEVSPDNGTVFELSFDEPYVSYRAFRFPWQGFPDAKPALAFKVEAGDIILGYSWNGATGVVSWRVYGGSSPQSLALIEEKSKADFETQSVVSGLAQGECYFQAAAVDASGKEMARSEIISTDSAACPLP